MKNILKSNYVRYIGYLITAVSFYYVYTILQDYNLESLKLDLTIHSYLWILVIGIFHIGNILLGGINYLILLKFVTKPNQKEVNLKYLSIFLVAGIAKYVPGNMMHYLGRNIIGSKYVRIVESENKIIYMRYVFKNFIIKIILNIFCKRN